MPTTIFNWLTITSRPRNRGGDISAMYMGVTIDTPPIANPPRKRAARNSPQLRAKPQPNAEAKKQTASTNNAFFRPKTSDGFPIAKEPMMVPIMAVATVNPRQISSGSMDFPRCNRPHSSLIWLANHS